MCVVRIIFHIIKSYVLETDQPTPSRVLVIGPTGFDSETTFF